MNLDTVQIYYMNWDTAHIYYMDWYKAQIYYHGVRFLLYQNYTPCNFVI